MLTTIYVVATLLTSAVEPTVENGSFRQWRDGRPVGWEIADGAVGEGASSLQIRPADGGGLSLEGGPDVGRWPILTQRVRVASGEGFRLLFQARAVNVRREKGQFESCAISCSFRTADDRLVTRASRTIVGGEWSEGFLTMHAPPGTAFAEIEIFLAKSGVLQVRAVRAQRIPAESAFALLVDELDRYYPWVPRVAAPETAADEPAAGDSGPGAPIDWRVEAARVRESAETAAGPLEFLTAVRPLLAKIGDSRVRIDPPRVRPSQLTEVSPPIAIEREARVGNLGTVGVTADGFGYVHLTRLHGSDAEFRTLHQTLDLFTETAGWIIDLRSTSGGSRRRAERVVHRFVEKSKIYARGVARSGVRRDDRMEIEPLRLPAHPRADRRRLVVLIGAKTRDGAEWLAQMFRFVPHATLVGTATPGSLCERTSVTLSNGVQLSYPQWDPLTPDGRPLRRGITPDVTIEPRPDEDPALTVALEVLRTRPSRRGR